ncbi:coiled-coil domain-containing protein 125 [Xenopus laevis]|uniref:Coiled-coil domain-containing protein 125 n=2 Tax=Xenopus laevis TaxID=8355 RepID=A0A1L8HRD7_XENLA|nr:coiled-coil domain-containing protein 125 [Xenopus laevis]XP_041436425.1 coiled-coil domain-containing protein 125 [Xenopus laevis]OCT98622.1 hypothetical protein XELAEV_18010858mg [Xenopus laevis]
MNNAFAAERNCHSEEEEDFMAGGDLGEGFGRKPGGLYDGSVNHMAETFKIRRASDNQGHYQLVKKSEDSGTASCSVLRNSVSEAKTTHKFGQIGYSRCRQNSIDASSEVSNEELKQRLQELTEEVDFLRIELEASQRQLNGKDEALKLLQSMAMLDKATSHTKEMLQKAEQERRTLEKEISVLEWEIQFDQVRLKNLEETWKEKYERVLCENATIKETLEFRTNEMKSLKSENTILNQQCQELLAMLDVNQQKVFQDNMSLNKSSLADVTAVELAVLGACTCSDGGPCSCAKISAATRKQLLQLSHELEAEKKSKEEAYIMADGFRIAFEQQLKRRNDVGLQLDDMEKLCKKGNKILPNWKLLKENGHLFSRESYKGLGQKLKSMLISPADCKNVESLDEPQEILKKLIDLLNDKEEALAHQRKVSYMLARTMEEKVDPATITKSDAERDLCANNLQHNSLDKRLTTHHCTCLTYGTSSDSLDSAEGNISLEESKRTIQTLFSSLPKESSPKLACVQTTESSAERDTEPAGEKHTDT